VNKGIATGLKKNWFLLLACAISIGAGIFLGLTKKPIELKEAGVYIDLPADSDAAREIDARIAKPFRTVSRKESKARAAIERYVAENSAVGPGEIEEKNLYRIGNLYYASIFDYEKATLAYIQLINNYPKTDKLQMAYVALADCYAKMGDEDQEIETYTVITQKFPVGSGAHTFAMQQLEGQGE
jgi:tetratricopeptide (TPR) repeat protein